MLVAGYAKVPAMSGVHGTHDHFTVSLVIDTGTHRVEESDSTAATTLTRRWLARRLTGLDFSAPIEPVLEALDDDYLGQGAGAMRQAVLDAWRRYAAYRNPGTTDSSQ